MDPAREIRVKALQNMILDQLKAAGSALLISNYGIVLKACLQVEALVDGLQSMERTDPAGEPAEMYAACGRCGVIRVNHDRSAVACQEFRPWEDGSKCKEGAAP